MVGAQVLDVLDVLVGIGGAVWRASWQASVLAALVLVVQLVLGRRIAARWRHAMWLLVLVRLALPVVPSSPLSVFNLAPSMTPRPAPSPVTTVDDPRVTIAWTESATVELDPPLAASRIDAAWSAKPQAALVPAPAPGPTAPPVAPDLWAGWPEVLAALWALGAVLLALRIAWATWRVSRTIRTLDLVDDVAVHAVLRTTAAELGVRRPPLLLAGEGLFSPALVGCLRPKLLVPRGLLTRFDPAELRLVFLHELAHLKRRDVAINWAATVLAVLHWPNPVGWLVVRRLRLERELACDVLSAATGDTDRRAYGHTIVKLLETFSRGDPGGGASYPPQPIAGGMGILEGKEQMKRRIVMIAQFARSSRTWTVVAACLVLALGLVALTDAVQAEEPTKPAAATPAAAAAAETANPSTQPAEGSTLLLQDAPPAVEELAKSDPAVLQYLTKLRNLEFQRATQVKDVGEKHPSVVVLDNEIEATRTFLDALAAAHSRRAKRAKEPTKIRAGDLVTVSIMDLVGQGVETVKTARVDGDGTINLPFAGAVKAADLTPRELEKAVAKTLNDLSIVQSAVVAVSMPERGESHQIAKVREPPPAGMGATAAPAVEGSFGAMMEDVAMFPGMAPQATAAAPAPEWDEATKTMMSRKIPELKLDNVPLADVVDGLRDLTNANIVVNWRALEAAGIEGHTAVTLRLRDVAFKDVLALVLRNVGGGATYKVENGAIIIDAAHAPARRPKMTTKAYDVDRLLGGRTAEERQKGIADLQQVIMTNAKPKIPADGSFAISAFDDRLIVTTSGDVHQHIEQLLKLLERSGGQPATRPADPAIRLDGSQNF